ncbi:mitochondrial proton/calcium exchanger protein-like protein isoform X1, partial [Tanacetum coccineum]
TRSTETSGRLAAIQAQLNNLEREIKKVNEKVYAAQVECEECKGPHYTKDCPLKEEDKTLEEAYYTQFGGPFQGGGYIAAAPGFYQRNNANPAYQERRQSMEETLSKFMSESTKRHEENSNMIKEIQALTDVAIRNQGASIKTLEIQIGQISKVLQERGFGSLPSSTKSNLRDHVKSISTTDEANSNPIRRIGSPQYAVSTPQNRRLMFESRQTIIPFLSRLNDYYLKKRRDHMDRNSRKLTHMELHILIIPYPEAERPRNVSVLPLSTYLNLGLGELAHTKLTVELADRTVKYPKGIVENVLLEARLMGETLVLNISLDPLYGDYIELNDLNVPLELKRDQVDDFMPTIEEGEEIDEPMIDIIKTRNNKSFDEEFYNSIIKDKVEYKGKNVVRAFMNVPIFVEKFSVVTHFVVVENMDGYRDQDMRDIILGEQLCKASCVEARRFDGLIIIHNGSDNVTYQMTRSHPRFKHLSNAQCNKIKPLIKVSMHDKLNGISHPKAQKFLQGGLELRTQICPRCENERMAHTRAHKRA